MTERKVITHCLKCNEAMHPYLETQVCMKEGCERFGLLTVVGKIEEIVSGG